MILKQISSCVRQFPHLWNYQKRFTSKSAIYSQNLASLPENRNIMETDEDNFEWSFGFGSNMDPAFMESSKGLKVHDFTPATLKGYRLAFRIYAVEFLEPSFANIMKCENCEVHGVLTKLSKEDAATLASQELAYVREYTDFTAYDGRVIKGFYFKSKPERVSDVDRPCSKRYLDVLIKGAKAACLQECHVKRLESTTYYLPSAETLKFRDTLPRPEELPKIPFSDLESGGDGFDIASCLGYVVKRSAKILMVPTNRDITSWAMCRIDGLETQSHDGGGKPPYPLVSAMTPEEMEYARQCLDYLLLGGGEKSSDGEMQPVGEIIGFLKEFAEQQHKPAEEALQLYH